MSESPQRDIEPAIRIVAAGGCVIFLVLATIVGVESLHAKNTGELMSNWHNGKMQYGDGLKITGILGLLAATWCYCAVKPRSIAQAWNREKK